MVKEQIAARGISDPRVLAAMLRVPREQFVGPGLADRAYDDHPLPIGFGQTISQPFVVARMCELLAPSPMSRVLEVGAGCGYQTAVLAELAGEVLAVEIVPALADRATRTLAALGKANARVACFDGTCGWAEHAPYDGIIIAAGAPKVPVLLLAQLAERGRLVLPVGPRDQQRLAVLTRRGDTFERTDDAEVRFVDLIGRFGWGGSGPGEA